MVSPKVVYPLRWPICPECVVHRYFGQRTLLAPENLSFKEANNHHVYHLGYYAPLVAFGVLPGRARCGGINPAKLV